MENFYQVVDLQCQAPKALSEINKDFWYIPFQVIKPCMTSLRILCHVLFGFVVVFRLSQFPQKLFLWYLFLSTSHSERLVFNLRFLKKQLTFPCNLVWKNCKSKSLFLLLLGWMKVFCPEE